MKEQEKIKIDKSFNETLRALSSFNPNKKKKEETPLSKKKK
ncbi:MAG: hypothetical protein ACRCTJ_00960 [Brevinema sp.]